MLANAIRATVHTVIVMTAGTVVGQVIKENLPEAKDKLEEVVQAVGIFCIAAVAASVIADEYVQRSEKTA